MERAEFMGRIREEMGRDDRMGRDWKKRNWENEKKCEGGERNS